MKEVHFFQNRLHFVKIKKTFTSFYRLAAWDIRMLVSGKGKIFETSTYEQVDLDRCCTLFILVIFSIEIIESIVA